MGRLAILFRDKGRTTSMSPQEVVNRFSQYYQPLKSGDVFHKSDSFTGKSMAGNVVFEDAFGGYKPNNSNLIPKQQQRTDLKQLLADFNNYTLQNPGIYSNAPTSDSRGRMYSKHAGFAGNYPDRQYADRRRIADTDLQFVKALDTVGLQGTPLTNTGKLAPFLSNNGKITSLKGMNMNESLLETFNPEYLEQSAWELGGIRSYDRAQKLFNS